jgi:hypothetical protein
MSTKNQYDHCCHVFTFSSENIEGLIFVVKIFPVLYSLFSLPLLLVSALGDFFVTFVSIRNRKIYSDIILKMKVI